MSIRQAFENFRNNYVIRQVQKVKLPEFSEDTIHRYEIIFSGRVQKVGFRLEVCELAKRLGLTGFCKNLVNGNVLAQIQGPDNKIWFLVSFMESLVRIKIKEKVIKELEVDMAEKDFLQQ